MNPSKRIVLRSRSMIMSHHSVSRSSLYSFCPWGWLPPWFSPFSFELWPVENLSWVLLLSDQVSQPYVITESTHSLNNFLFSLIGTFLSRLMSSLQNALHPCPILIFISCTWSWSLVTICPRYTYLLTSLIFSPSTITLYVLTCLLHISLPQMHFL